MTYTESAALMNDMDFRGRIKASCLEFAAYIQGEAPGTEGHTPRYRWAGDCYRAPDNVAIQVHPVVVMDPQVQLDGAAISDEQLKMAVQRAVNRFM